jgi:hypothetical protein
MQQEPGGGGRAPQGHDFVDPASSKSFEDASPSGNAFYYMNTLPSTLSDRSGSGSFVGSTYASSFGDNSYNGAKTRAFEEIVGYVRGCVKHLADNLAICMPPPGGRTANQMQQCTEYMIGSLTPSGGLTKVTSMVSAGRSVVSGLKLQKSLASAEQMGQEGRVIAGRGSKDAFRDAYKFSEDFGGTSEDWVKKSSTNFVAKDGTSFETHWVENINTGERVEFKTLFK